MVLIVILVLLLLVLLLLFLALLLALLLLLLLLVLMRPLPRLLLLAVAAKAAKAAKAVAAVAAVVPAAVVQCCRHTFPGLRREGGLPLKPVSRLHLRMYVSPQPIAVLGLTQRPADKTSSQCSPFPKARREASLPLRPVSRLHLVSWQPIALLGMPRTHRVIRRLHDQDAC